MVVIEIVANAGPPSCIGSQSAPDEHSVSPTAEQITTKERLLWKFLSRNRNIFLDAYGCDDSIPTSQMARIERKSSLGQKLRLLEVIREELLVLASMHSIDDGREDLLRFINSYFSTTLFIFDDEKKQTN